MGKTERRIRNFLLFILLMALPASACAEGAGEGQHELLGPEAAEAAKIYEADLAALAAVMRKAERKEAVTVAVIGGSITEGTVTAGKKDTAVGGRRAYADLFFGWWRQAFPETEFRFINAGIGATDSYLGVHRVQRDVLDYRPDLVLVEFSVNDANDMKAKTSYENLVRRILEDEAHPAVILLFMGQTNGASAQVAHAAVGKHYGLPAVSYKNVIGRLMEEGTYTAADLSGDEVHPSALGHRIAYELLRNLLEQACEIRDIAGEPGTDLGKPATKEKYLNARIADSSCLVPAECGSFAAKNVFSRFPNGWQTAGGGGKFSFTDTFATLGVLWLRQVSGKCGRADVYVDGERKATLDGNFPGGWGDYAAAKEVYASGEPAEHLVEIVMQEGDRDKLFTLLGFLLAD